MKTKLTQEERDKRLDARWEIIRTANRHIMYLHRHNPNYYPMMMGIRNINRAVKICRHHMLISGKTLIEAGFKPHTAKPGKPTVLKKLLGER